MNPLLIVDFRGLLDNRCFPLQNSLRFDETGNKTDRPLPFLLVMLLGSSFIFCFHPQIINRQILFLEDFHISWRDHRRMKLYFVLLMKSHLQSYPCPLQINSFWNLGLLLGITIILQRYKMYKEITVSSRSKGTLVCLPQKGIRCIRKSLSLLGHIIMVSKELPLTKSNNY